MDTLFPGRGIACWFIQSQERCVSFWVPRDLLGSNLGFCVLLLDWRKKTRLSFEVWVLVNHVHSNYDTRTFSFYSLIACGLNILHAVHLMSWMRC